MNAVNLEKVLRGAKGISYLMYVGREVNTANVVDLLYQNRIVKNRDVVYGYTNDLEKIKLIKTTKVLPQPGPPKIRTARLEPIFHTVSFYRSWKTIPTDKRTLSKEEKQRIALLFKNMAPLLDCFPQYLSLSLNVSKKIVRNLRWTETLSIFLEFCFRIVENCWSIYEHNLNLKEPPHSLQSKTRVFQDLAMAPQVYIYDAYQKGQVTTQTISGLANFSINGHKDIYRDTFLRELYLMFISLRNPLDAYVHVMHTEDMASAIAEGLLDGISVLALNQAIFDKAGKEYGKIKKESEKVADHKVRDETLHKLVQHKEEDVEKALEGIIQRFNLAMSTDELMRALVNVELRKLLRSHVEQLKPTFYVNRKERTIHKK